MEEYVFGNANQLNTTRIMADFLEDALEKKCRESKPECYVVTYCDYLNKANSLGFSSVVKAIKYMCEAAWMIVSKLKWDGYEPNIERYPDNHLVITTANDDFVFYEWKLVQMTGEDVDDIMSSALDRIGYWCSDASPREKYLGEYASEQISRGGTLALQHKKGKATLNLEKFFDGFRLWLKEGGDVHGAVSDGKINPGLIDGPAADQIIQYAVFGELVFG